MSTPAPTAADGHPSTPAASWLHDRSMAAGLAVVASMVFMGVIIRLGWLSDDAFVSFRAIDNLVSGRGLVSNVGERVQGFTNPLWTLLVAVAYWPSGDIYGSAMVLSLLCCLGTVYFVWRLHRGGWRTAWALLLLAMSVRFGAFSTGGLENCLAHLLLAAFFYLSTRQPASSPWFWLVGGLVVLNRLDHALLVLPALGLVAARDWRQSWRLCLLGLAPLAAWFLFAIVYYGFPYPNTAYAKLNTAIPLGAQLAQGLAYLTDSVFTDPLVLPVILLSLLATLWSRPRSPLLLAHGVGVLLYLIYVCGIGGDFMSGRFLTAPFLVAVLLLSELIPRQPLAAVALAAVALLTGHRLLAPVPSDGGGACAVPPSGIVDERVCYVEHTGLAQNVRTKKFKRHAYFQEGIGLRDGPRRVVVNDGPGLAGFAAGPGVHTIDPMALTDPLLARISFRPGGDWRPGHFTRPVPDGYPESVERGENLVKDPCARDLLTDLWLITRGPLFSAARWGAIVRRNLLARTCPTP